MYIVVAKPINTCSFVAVEERAANQIIDYINSNVRIDWIFVKNEMNYIIVFFILVLTFGIREYNRI